MARNVFISGMARGVDIWAAEIVLRLRKEGANVKLICASPYEGFERGWSAEWQRRYNVILAAADLVRFICPGTAEPASRSAMSGCRPFGSGNCCVQRSAQWHQEHD